jgi:hypothetical protein
VPEGLPVAVSEVLPVEVGFPVPGVATDDGAAESGALSVATAAPLRIACAVVVVVVVVVVGSAEDSDGLVPPSGAFKFAYEALSVEI